MTSERDQYFVKSNMMSWIHIFFKARPGIFAMCITMKFDMGRSNSILSTAAPFAIHKDPTSSMPSNSTLELYVTIELYVVE